MEAANGAVKDSSLVHSQVDNVSTSLSIFNTGQRPSGSFLEAALLSFAPQISAEPPGPGFDGRPLPC